MELIPDMQQQAKAISDPTRFRILQHITDAAQPIGVAELTELLGFNHNAIRQHLAVLVASAMIVENDEPRTSPGRPRKQYSSRADMLSAFTSVTGSYDKLSRLLLRLATTDLSSYEVGYEMGVEEANPSTNESAAVRLVSELARGGFEPALDSTGQTVVLNNCPFSELATENPGVVCELHRGLIQGNLASGDVAIHVTLTPGVPRRAGCEVVLRPGGENEPVPN